MEQYMPFTEKKYPSFELLVQDILRDYKRAHPDALLAVSKDSAKDGVIHIIDSTEPTSVTYVVIKDNQVVSEQHIELHPDYNP
jgi:hypothetical protein